MSINPPCVSRGGNRLRGQVGYYSGIGAEEAVARDYEGQGARVMARRWRSGAGEIDLVLRQGDVTVFVEVKRGVTHALAAERVSYRQRQRMMAAAQIYMAREDPFAEMRFDIALVDHGGRIELLCNAVFADH